jgi:hypothetical protein
MLFLHRSGNAQFLAGMDQVRVLDLVLVGLEDRRPAASVAVHVLGDAAQGVARLHYVGARRGLGFLFVRAPGLCRGGRRDVEP